MIGLLCVVVVAMLSPVADVVVGSFVAARTQSPILAMLVFFAVVFINLGIKPLLRRPLSAGEQMTIYCMMLASAGIASSGLVDYFIPHLVGVFHFASAENNFAALFFQHIPDWLVPSKDSQSAAVAMFYRGGSSVPWGAWVRPLALWSTFFAAMYAVQWCLASILRKQWVDRDRLTFPLIRLPLALVDGDGRGAPPALRSPLFWGAAIVLSLFYTFKNLGELYPSLARVSVVYDLAVYVPESIRPHLHGLFIYIYPVLIAFFYFTTREVSFSLAFFYLYMKLQQVVGGMMGVDWFTSYRWVGSGYGPAAAVWQNAGAAVVLVLFSLYVMRRHIGDVLRRALGRGSPADDRDEAIPYRWTVIGLAGGLLYMAGFLSWAGMSFWLALALMVVMCMWLIVLTRQVAEGGVLWGHVTATPYDVVSAVAGTEAIGVRNWTMIGFCYMFMIDMQAAMMPASLHTLKIADEVRLNRRRLVLAVFAAIAVCIPIAYYSHLKASYAFGATRTNYWTAWTLLWSPPLPFAQAAHVIARPFGTDWHGIGFLIAGAAQMVLLYVLRYRFIWWPLHPIGLTLMSTFPLFHMWFSALAAFVIKTVVLDF